MRRGLVVLILAGALAALFVSAARSPGTAQTVGTSLVLVKLTGTGCMPAPDLNPVCGSHEQAEKIRARFGAEGMTVAVHGKTVLLA